PTEPTEDDGPKYLTYGEGTYERQDDETVYEFVLGDYTELMNAAKAAETVDERFVLFAQAEAALLDSAVMIPTTTKGGVYQISHIAPRTVPYVQWGNDDDRVKSLVISDEFLTPAERADLFAMWDEAVAAQDSSLYKPAEYLAGKGHTILNDYVITFSTAPVTLDWLNTSSQSDTEITVNTVDGLVEYNNINQLTPALAESWEISDDGLTYTFHIREGVYWYTAEGTQYAEVTAADFEAGFHHMLDAQAGLEWLVDGVIAGATEYYSAGGSWSDVGYKATDKYTLTITLEQPTSYFMTMLTYSCFLPICDSFYQARGGVYGVAEYAAASADTNAYTFGQNTDVSSQVYCGPFLVRQLQPDSLIYLVRNENYYKNDEVTLNSIKWIFDDGSNMTAYYNDTVKGIYAACTLRESNGTLAMAKADGNFDKYAYVTETQSTTYFGGLNVNRGTYALEGGLVASPKTEQQKIDTAVALSNKNFRKAMQFAFDKGTYNAVSTGEDLKYTSLRNMYTHPEFVSLSNDTTDAEGHTFPAGTFYGEIVQYYCDKLGAGIKVADQIDGWYNPTAAKEHLEAAKEELGDAVNWPITIDVVYGSYNETLTAGANAYKTVIENTLGVENVVVNLVEATTAQDYYAGGYRASNGEAGNFDMFYGSGWGPDYGDPSTYLDTFLGEGAGYMAKVIGLF
ncbi:MAG: peptide ABC transporter substrate-binding protein, partial [Clostridia bacterium]|nr:peptide ABC transporter substrate-binding protein [Clostridia bacterium]